MTVQFCSDCGNLLPSSQDRQVKCDCCAKLCKNTLLGSVSFSSTSDFPSELRNKRIINMPKQLSAQDTWSRTDVKCRECGAEEVQYTALQLRSADEGTTMFYSCPKCSAR
ncbi:hypothetical protein UVI_02060600 [Ustilaginoidea virens]|nr:hypothetical protein UVI_02060600 [Ustilaginoidea virens]